VTTTRPLAALLSIGDELVLGEKLDTNSMWLADRLGAIGLLVSEHRTAPDNHEAIASAMVHLVGSADAVVVGGGLGPTADDMTRQGLARALEILTGQAQPLVEDAHALEAIRAIFARTGRDMPEANRVQALRPSGAHGLPNAHGTAPGMLARVELAGRTRIIACLPGPPHEMRPMFAQAVEPALRAMPGVAHAELRVVQVFGLGESEVATRIADLMQRDNNPAVGTTASAGLVSCRVRVEPGRDVRGPYSASDPMAAAQEAVSIITARCEGYVANQSGRTLAATLMDEAAARAWTVATAESCTGGLVGQLITAEPGSSRAYLGGWVTYSNAMKASELGVRPGDLDEFGAVSREVAVSMARGAAARSGARLALSITGVAGPDGGTSEKPVGTVWIGYSGEGTQGACQFRFSGDRASIRKWAASTALFIGLGVVRGRAPGRLLRQVD
jgi:nicotinamide-nucleotide amidase